jgi:hypothetical protein
MVDIKVNDQSGDAYVTSYKSYVALISQLNTDNPVATPLNSGDSNYIGNIVWARIGIGNYTGTLADAFPSGKTWILITSNNGFDVLTSGYIDNTPNGIFLEVGAVATDDYKDSWDLSIEIRVYP